MAYHFRLSESLPEGITRIAHEQIDGAIEQLQDQQRTHEDRVHQARKRFKKLRGLLRLVRPALGSEVYQQENRFFRDAGRTFAQVRDAEAIIETYDTFQADLTHHLGNDKFHSLRAALEQRQQHIVEKKNDLDVMIVRVLDDLQASHKRVETWPLAAVDFEALAAGLQRTYRRGSKAYKQAYAEPTAEHFHEWRKRVKYHWYHVRLLEYIWAEVMHGRRHAIKYLSNLLGDDHDLAVLRQTVQQQPALFDGTGDIDMLHEALDQKQAQLRAAVDSIGKRVFAEKPKHLTRRIHHYWDAWQMPGEPVEIY